MKPSAEKIYLSENVKKKGAKTKKWENATKRNGKKVKNDKKWRQKIRNIKYDQRLKKKKLEKIKRKIQKIRITKEQWSLF